ncbi:MAG: hypothetical protein PHS32_07920 [Rhodoferax sp.]|uniref:hypothetical protein n=1 Tax=Rhodoferax sp. TaxID=50421 RepID=UPI00261FDA14|nr:hypothetical protein [Rhodoferax sp.]MDD5333647.1 hypothetical protein [Rhodoferax sp.]MDD5333657.1 hypothetical protein [Rhodoferax sp.]
MAYFHRLIFFGFWTLACLLPAESHAIVPQATAYEYNAHGNIACVAPTMRGSIDCAYAGASVPVANCTDTSCQIYVGFWLTVTPTFITYLACPANSSQSGTGCACTSPYVEDATHTSCIAAPLPCPVGNAVTATIGLGWFKDGGSLIPIYEAAKQSICVQNGSSVCAAYVNLQLAYPGEKANGYVSVTGQVGGTLSGATCTGPVTPATVTSPAPACDGKLGNLNGVTVCIPNESAAAKEARAQSAASAAAATASADATASGAIPAVASAAAAAAGSAAGSTVRSGGTSAAAAAAGKAAGDAVVAGGSSASAIAASAGSAAGAASAAAASSAGLSPAVVQAASDAAKVAASTAALQAASSGSSVADSFAAGLAAGLSAGAAASQAAGAAAAKAMADALAAGKTAAEQAAAGAAAAAAAAAANAANVAAVKAAGDAALAQAIAAGQNAAQQAAAVLAAQQAAAASASAAARQAAEAAAQAAGKNAAAIAAAGEAAAAAAAAALKASNDALNKALDALAAEAAKKAEKPPNPLDEFCANNPGSPMCKESVDSKFTAACGAPPTCEGDAVACAIAAATFDQDCIFKQESDESRLYGSKKALSGNQTGGLPGNETVAIGSSSFSTVDVVGGGSTGLADLTISILSRSVTLPLSQVNSLLAGLGNLLMAVTFLLCARIVARG